MDEILAKKGVAVAFVAMLVVAAVMMYAMMSLLGSMHEDPYDHSYGYELQGTSRGVACEGSGTMEYVSENNNYHLYRFSGEVISSDGRTDKIDLGALFNEDETMEPSLYTFLRNDVLDGTEVTVWQYDRSGERCTYYVGEYCKVLRLDIVSGDCELIGLVE